MYEETTDPHENEGQYGHLCLHQGIASCGSQILHLGNTRHHFGHSYLVRLERR